MHALPLDRKRYLLRQNRQHKASQQAASQRSNPAGVMSLGPSSGAGYLPRIVPQLTGDVMKRFSVAWNGSGPPPAPSSPLNHRTDHARRARESSVEHTVQQPLQPQTTGGLWSSWWASSGGTSSGSGHTRKDSTGENTPRWYVDGLMSYKTTDVKLVKHLISLRVHLSTANLIWIEQFVVDQRGLDTLGGLLGGLVGKGGKRKTLTEVESSNLLEIIKCLRVLLNTEVCLIS
jgi:diaphanous 1